MRKLPLLRLFTYVTSFLSTAYAFSVTVGTPTQCDPLPVSWSGGQAPFQITLTPFAQPLINVSVPTSTFINGEGSYSIPQLQLPSEKQFLLTMSDATGFGSGGTTTILTVGNPIADNSCNTSTGVPDFYFSTPLELQQCNNYVFDLYNGAVLPATITVLIPGGEHAILSPVTGPSYTWVADVVSGTDLLFLMIDSEGRQGGVSPLTPVLALDNTSCLNATSPSSTISATSPSSIMSAPSNTPSPTHSGSNAVIGVIAGSAVGGVVFLVLLILVGIYCIRRVSHLSHRKDDGQEVMQNSPSQRQTDYDSHLPLMRPGSLPTSDPFNQYLRQISYTDSFAGNSSISSASRLMTVGSQTPLPVGLAAPLHSGIHSRLTNPPASSFAFDDRHALSNQMQLAAMAGQTSESDTFPYQTHPGVSHPTLPIKSGALHYASTSNVTTDDPPPSLPTQSLRLSSNIDSRSSHMSSAGGRINAGSGQAAASRGSAHIIIHTDIEDVPASADAQEVVELPPQYTERHTVVLQPPPTSHQKFLDS